MATARSKKTPAESAQRGKKTRLGKGLGALLGEYLPEEVGASDRGYQVVPVAKIVPNPLQPRREFTDDQLGELEASIRENGLLQPLVVRPATEESPNGAEWELVAGERRWRAVRRLGWTEVPVLIREMDNRTLLVLAIVENVQREDLSALEEAEGYRRLIDDFGYTQKDVAESVAKERSTIANMLRLLQLPASVRNLLSRGALSMGHARAILGLNDERQMADLARRVIAEGLTVRAVEDRVRRQRSGGKTTAPRATKRTATKRSADPHLRRLETELQRLLGTAARIHVGKSHTGHIEIPFYGAEDFERVMDALLSAEANRV